VSAGIAGEPSRRVRGGSGLDFGKWTSLSLITSGRVRFRPRALHVEWTHLMEGLAASSQADCLINVLAAASTAFVGSCAFLASLFSSGSSLQPLRPANTALHCIVHRSTASLSRLAGVHLLRAFSPVHRKAEMHGAELLCFCTLQHTPAALCGPLLQAIFAQRAGGDLPPYSSCSCCSSSSSPLHRAQRSMPQSGGASSSCGVTLEVGRAPLKGGWLLRSFSP